MLLLQLTTLQLLLVVVLLSAAVAGVVFFVRSRRRRPVATAAEEAPEVAGDESFEARIPEYAATIRQWFDTEHPYFNQAFKLTDVQAVVPLNRTYLSRIFNEGLGESFSDYVRDRRMTEAMRLLTDEPDTPIADIAEHCGFASHSSFHRAFVRFTGMKPGDYRSGNKPA